MNVYTEVLNRYSEGARAREESLCCPVDYDRELLKILPAEIIERDYGCGDPSRYVREGDTVLDLGSGGGKICYMAAQLVGPEGKVIGVDMNDDMLALARRHQKDMAEKLGGDRVEFKKGFIQDLALDVEALEANLAEKPIDGVEALQQLESLKAKQKKQAPMIADSSVDLVISNCVLNLVSDEQKTQLVKEIFRVLKPGGRVAISDIVSDEFVPQHLKDDGELWSGCLSGAFQEKEFFQVFADAGFQALA
ncbi:MAG: methyltransferase domain-containing protein, partial [Gammaproteobacteria bacterium]|nr:methyltransferase domain-containing protein [Gammaproteobacteria bacterium]